MNKSVWLFLTPVMLAISVVWGVRPVCGGILHDGLPEGFPGCVICHDFENGVYDNPGPDQNLRWVRRTIEYPLGTFHTVIFTSPEGPNSLADGDDVYDGPCEVCHTNTFFHTNTGDGTDHFDGQDCAVCHPHFPSDDLDFFVPSLTGPQAHTTHLSDPKGPRLSSDCYACHDEEKFYFPNGDVKFSDGLRFGNTRACDHCHSPRGDYDGVNDDVIGAKKNWEDGIYDEQGKLRAGKEYWCAGCHDDQPANSQADGTGIYAPNVMGDGLTYGFKISGHGRNPERPVYCHDCHDTAYDPDKDDECRQYGGIAWAHIDGEPRTYVAAPLTYNYRCGYRLNENMVIPRDGQYGQNAFKLCYKGCHHLYIDQFSPATGFRDDAAPALNYHDRHLDELFRRVISWDSDWDGVEDSAISCTACHNVHGSPMAVDATLEPNPVMIRHGELISTPGTSDKVPALDFRWYDATHSQVALLKPSRKGGLLSTPGHDISFNHVCWGACHVNPPGGGEITYTRTPNVSQAPTIDRLRPRRAEPKDIVKIVGSGFGEPSDGGALHLGGRAIESNSPRIKLWTPTLIQVRTPDRDCGWFGDQAFRRVGITVDLGGAESNKVKLKVLKPEACSP